MEQGCGNCYVGREERKLPVKVLQAAMGREGIIVVIDYYKAHSYIDVMSTHHLLTVMVPYEASAMTIVFKQNRYDSQVI